jgi:hypothetical protein
VAVSESEVICDLRCGGKAKGTHLWASVFEGVRNKPIHTPPPLTPLATALVGDGRGSGEAYTGLQEALLLLVLIWRLVLEL